MPIRSPARKRAAFTSAQSARPGSGVIEVRVRVDERLGAGDEAHRRRDHVTGRLPRRATSTNAALAPASISRSASSSWASAAIVVRAALEQHAVRRGQLEEPLLALRRSNRSIHIGSIPSIDHALDAARFDRRRHGAPHVGADRPERFAHVGGVVPRRARRPPRRAPTLHSRASTRSTSCARRP